MFSEHPIYKEVYKQRREKVSRQRAIYSARAAVMAEELKEYLKPEEQKKKTVVRKKELPSYRVGDNKVILTLDANVLEKFPHVKHKGMIKNMTGEFEKEIIYKLMDSHDVKLNPNQFYIIFGD